MECTIEMLVGVWVSAGSQQKETIVEKFKSNFYYRPAHLHAYEKLLNRRAFVLIW